MHAIGQVFRYDLAAAGTHLRGVARIDCDTCPTGPFCLVGRVLSKLTPRSIRDAFVHTAPVIILHILNVQILESDDLKPIYKSSTQLVRKVFAAIRDAIVDMLDDSFMLAVLRRALHIFAQLALCFGKRLFVPAKESRVSDLLASRESSEVSQAYINTDNLVSHEQWDRLNDAGEAGIPIPQSIAADGERLDLAFDGAMQFDLDIADLGETQAAIIKESPVPLLLRIGERIIASFSAESRIARLLPGLHATKERCECKIDTQLGILLHLGMPIAQVIVFLSPLSKQLVRIIERQRFLLILPGLTAYFEGLVVYPSAGIQIHLHPGTLASSWIKPEPERLHTDIVYPFAMEGNSRVGGTFIAPLKQGALCIGSSY